MQVKDKDVLDMMMKTDSTLLVPGSQHKYSNTGYALLALTVEKITGMPFRDFLKENIFAPLEMNNTVAFEENINEVEFRAYGLYSRKMKLHSQSKHFSTQDILGNSKLFFVHNTYKWDQALYTNKLINKKYLEESGQSAKPMMELNSPMVTVGV